MSPAVAAHGLVTVAIVLSGHCDGRIVSLHSGQTSTGIRFKPSVSLHESF